MPLSVCSMIPLGRREVCGDDDENLQKKTGHHITHIIFIF